MTAIFLHKFTPYPEALNESRRCVYALRGTGFDTWWGKSSYGVDNKACHPFATVEGHLGYHAVQDITTESMSM